MESTNGNDAQWVIISILIGAAAAGMSLLMRLRRRRFLHVTDDCFRVISSQRLILECPVAVSARKIGTSVRYRSDPWGVSAVIKEHSFYIAYTMPYRGNPEAFLRTVLYCVTDSEVASMKIVNGSIVVSVHEAVQPYELVLNTKHRYQMGDLWNALVASGVALVPTH